MARTGIHRLPFHPLFAALLPVLSMYTVTPGRAELTELIRASLCMVVVAFAIWAMFVVPLRDIAKAAVLATLTILLITLVTPGLMDRVDRSWLGDVGLTRRRYLMAMFGAVLLSMAIALHRTRRPLRSLTAGLNIVTLGFLIPSLATLLTVRAPTIHAEQRTGPILPVPKATAVPPAKPDIYYIVLDRYGDAATMREHGFDNSEFLEFLESRGFFVARESHANYLKTALSMSSSLNLRYHDDIVRAQGPESPNWQPINYRLKHHMVGRFLKSQGYRYIHSGAAWWPPTVHTPLADENISYYSVPDPVTRMFRQPLLAPVSDKLDSSIVDPRRLKFERVNRQLEALGRVPKQPGPKFVLAHFLVPHPPDVFNEDGSYATRKVQGDRWYGENYRHQVMMANRITAYLVRRILDMSPTPPVIIVQGDEGPYPNGLEGSGEYEFRGLTPAQLRLRSAILNAYYMPGPGRQQLYHSISPVNSFRVLFNVYFGTNLPLLSDRIFSHDSDLRPYSLADVTGRVRAVRYAAAEGAGDVRPPSGQRLSPDHP
jgi:hypothetical protein